MTYEEAVNYIEGIGKFAADTSLTHTDRLLDKLGHPENGKKIIHVAGTNGKGSVCAYLRAMLAEGGYRVGFFTSPHLVRINERFQIGTEEVDDDTFLWAFEKVKEAIDEFLQEGGSHPTYFETLFLMAVLIFQKADTDYIILEVGLGGRLDATNVIRHPMACVITSISLDHTEYLGDTTEKIAGEKAGIIKKGVPVIFDGHDRAAAAVIRRRAEELDSPCYELTQDCCRPVRTTTEGIAFDFTWRDEKSGGKAETFRLQIPQIAEYQMMNASLAFLTMLILQKDHGIPADRLAEGISKMVWPCRMETVLPGVVVDGAHNPDGIAQFVKTASQFHRNYEITVLFAAVSDKDHADMIREIVEGIHPERVITTRIEGSRCISEKTLAEEFARAGQQEVYSEPDVGRAFDLACSRKGDGMLFCVGSLYLAGQIKSHLAKK
ncbi:MAG: bifunctional folylpolyglutamate synthase/dihydrofolate synthase [Bilifractor porci]|jgi:dihydrofolate synthase/folylpolyglutamate synthase